MITEERIAELTKLGYYIEDMGKEWGSVYKGQYRFMNHDDEDTFGVIQYSVEDAWEDCSQYHDQL